MYYCKREPNHNSPPTATPTHVNGKGQLGGRIPSSIVRMRCRHLPPVLQPLLPRRPWCWAASLQSGARLLRSWPLLRSFRSWCCCRRCCCLCCWRTAKLPLLLPPLPLPTPPCQPCCSLGTYCCPADSPQRRPTAAGSKVRFVLMNSFSTSDDTKAYLRKSHGGARLAYELVSWFCLQVQPAQGPRRCAPCLILL